MAMTGEIADAFENLKAIIRSHTEMIELQAEVAKHDKLYEQAQPVLTDNEYDELFKRADKAAALADKCAAALRRFNQEMEEIAHD